MAKNEPKIISMPLFIETGVIKKVKRYINLNQYRNWHYQVSNNIKKAYKELVEPQIDGCSYTKVKLKFTLYPGSRRRIDRSNVLSVHEKFFCDAFVESGCLEDDNDNFLESTHYYSGELDRDNPRVDIEITDLS